MSNIYYNIRKINTTLLVLFLIVIKPIKTTYDVILNQIIRIGDLDFRYVNFASYSNGDMIVQTTACPGNALRVFYGIKSNGREFFNSDSETEKSYHYSITAEGQTGNNGNLRYEGVIFAAAMNENPNKGKEYLVSTSRYKYTELFDFDNNQMYQKNTPEAIVLPSMDEKSCIQAVQQKGISVFDKKAGNISSYMRGQKKLVSEKLTTIFRKIK